MNTQVRLGRITIRPSFCCGSAITTSATPETAGRLLGIATTTPSVVEIIDDLLTPDTGFAIIERDVEPSEIDGSPRHLADIVLGCSASFVVVGCTG